MFGRLFLLFRSTRRCNSVTQSCSSTSSSGTAMGRNRAVAARLLILRTIMQQHEQLRRGDGVEQSGCGQVINLKHTSSANPYSQIPQLTDDGNRNQDTQNYSAINIPSLLQQFENMQQQHRVHLKSSAVM
jgi:hypothetical protein